MRQEDFDRLHGFYFEDLEVGMNAEVTKVISEADVRIFADLSGDMNPLHLNEEFAKHTRAGGRVIHGMVTASLLSTIVGYKLPGPGCLWMAQTLRFLHPVRIGDRVRARGSIVELLPDKQRIKMEMICRVEDQNVIEGEALIWVPSARSYKSETSVQ
ncbi:MAG: MaoC family dehydratase [Arenicellales bacterium]|nr:MaoC family dehydratase [Arenicellales bacterium]